jgi:hypothetical protein
MKKYLTIILLFLSFSTTVFCQKPTFTFGVRSGVNLTNYKRTSDDRFCGCNGGYVNDKTTLFTLSLQNEVSFSKHFALQAEINFTQKGYQDNWSAVDGSNHSSEKSQFITNWLEIPFLAKVNFGKRSGMSYGLFLGPSVGYAFNGRYTSSYTYQSNGVDTTRLKNESIDFKYYNHKRYDIGLNLGGDISYKRIFFDARYQLGLKNLALDTNGVEESNISIKTYSFMLTLGYRTPIVKAKSEGPKRRILREIFN